MAFLTLRERAREEQVSKTSQFKLQAVLSQICDYSPLSVNNVLLELAKFYLTSFNNP